MTAEERDCIETVAPAWLDWALLSKWRLFNYEAPHVPEAVAAVQHIAVDGVLHQVRELKTAERKTAKNCFLRVSRPRFTQIILDEARLL